MPPVMTAVSYISSFSRSPTTLNPQHPRQIVISRSSSWSFSLTAVSRDDDDGARTVGTRLDPRPTVVELSGATVGGVTGLIVGGGIGGGICGKLKEGFLEFHPFAGPGGMPLTPAFCAKEADVSAIASKTLPLILPTKSDCRSPMGLLPALSMLLRAQLSQQFLVPPQCTWRGPAYRFLG
jgi:hypothetical protein